MIHEFAVDPEALASWQNFRFLVDQFGVHHGRLISRFPGKWKRMVFQACEECAPIEKERIIERLRGIDDKLLAAGRDYNRAIDWLPNALDSNAETPFHAIISTPAKVNGTPHLDVETLSGGDEKWSVPRGTQIPRTAAALAAAADTLLQCSSEIILVDQHYSCGSRHGQPLTEFLKSAQLGKPLSRLEYHLSAEKTGAPAWFRQKLEEQRRFFNLLPETQLVFVRWKTIDGGDNMHARFILTERGGLRYDYGLDEGDEGESTDVDCLDQEVYQHRWSQYHPESGDFELVDAWIVTATGVTEAKWRDGKFEQGKVRSGNNRP